MHFPLIAALKISVTNIPLVIEQEALLMLLLHIPQLSNIVGLTLYFNHLKLAKSSLSTK